MIPENIKREVKTISKKTMWIYGKPYSGKTYLANTFPDVLMLNTDGNIKFFDAPYVEIKDTMEGRIALSGWEVFKRTIDELAKGGNTFKTIVLDLMEDTYQYCRQYVLKKEGYSHETDGGYGKGWALVDDEFIPTIKRLLGLDYENIVLISHEVTNDLTSKNGTKINTSEPNLREKMALKIAGMVDFTGRFVTEGEVRQITIKPDPTVFGGGRAGFVGQTVNATYGDIISLYDVDTLEKASKPTAKAKGPKEEPKALYAGGTEVKPRVKVQNKITE